MDCVFKRRRTKAPHSPLGNHRRDVGGDAPRRGSNVARRWGVVLAGGDGVRLRELTRFVCGDDRPKQFCPLLGESTLLLDARRRAERSIHPDKILYSVTRAHRDYYLPDLADRPSQRIIQPCNRGTAPAILSTLLHILQMDPDALVAILPCDHHYAPERKFTAALDSAFAIAETFSESVVLLGARPKGPEVEYGWIEVGDRTPHPGVFRVKRFEEKPPIAIAERLYQSGSLWNTFIMVGHVRAFVDLALESVRDLMDVLRPALIHPSRDRELHIADSLYAQIGPMDFSRHVLAPGIGRLVTVDLGDVDWSDLGHPERVVSTLRERGELPGWALRWRSAKTAAA